MAKITSHQRTIREFFEGAMISIPKDYTYNYSEETSEKFWNELLNFSIPNGDYEAFDIDNEPLIGSVIKCSKNSKQIEIISNPKKLIMACGLMKVLYGKCLEMQAVDTENVLSILKKCI